MLKKYILAGVLAVGLFSSCEPLKDIENEMDAKQKLRDELIVKNLSREGLPESGAYTLLGADYDAMGTEFGQPGKFDNFSEEIDPAEFIPTFLYEKFLILEEETNLTVTYNFYTKSSTETNEVEIDYVLTDEDYKGLGEKYGNLKSPETQVPAVLRNVEDYIYATEGAQSLVEFKLYGKNEANFQEYKFDGEVWAKTEKVNNFNVEEAYTLVKDDYNSMGEGDNEPGEYDNFSSKIKPESFLPAFLKTKYSDAESENVVTIQFATYGAYTSVQEFTFDGLIWNVSENTTVEYDWSKAMYMVSVKTPSTVEEVSSDFGFKPSKTEANEGTWVADRSVKYELVSADYAEISEAAAEYGNFDIRDGKYYAKRKVLISDLGKFLETRFSDEVATGEVFTITYKYYNGSGGTGIIRIQKVEGAWIEIA